MTEKESLQKELNAFRSRENCTAFGGWISEDMECDHVECACWYHLLKSAREEVAELTAQRNSSDRTAAQRSQEMFALQAENKRIIADARMQGDALAAIFGVLTDAKVPTDPDALRAADMAADAIAALRSYCPHEAESELLQGSLRRWLNWCRAMSPAAFDQLPLINEVKSMFVEASRALREKVESGVQTEENCGCRGSDGTCSECQPEVGG